MKQHIDFKGFKTAETRASKALARLVGIMGSAILLLTFVVARAASSGPAAGGNTLTINGTALGNGSDITNVTICGVVAAIQSQTANSVTVITGAASDGGTGDIDVFSASVGVTTVRNGYTYNPPGSIFGAFMGWSSISNLSIGLYGFGLTSANGKVYMIAGNEGSGYLNEVEIYDPAQPTLGWMSGTSLPANRSALAAASVNGKIYAMGGWNITPTGSAYATVWDYDTAQPAQGWLSVSNLPVAASGFPAVGASGKIYVIEGQSAVYVHDPAQPTLGWLSVSNLPAGNYAAAAASVNGKIYAIGSGFYVYDPSQPTLGWLSLSNLPPTWSYWNLSAVSLNGKIYALGSNTTNAYVYDPSQPTLGWSSVNNLPATSGYVASASANGNIYAIEGNDGSPPPLAPAYAGSFAPGVVAPSGPLGGGNRVTISGNNLGNGDVTNVTLCGIPATIMADHSPTQVVVSAGAAAIAAKGDVVVNSTSYGVTVAAGAYTYLPPAPNALPATNVTVNSFYANWSSVSGATNYLLDVSTTSNFTADIAGYSSLSVGNATTFWVNGLNAATTYYYRVRCQENGVTSSNSSTISVQTPGGVSLSNGPAAGGNTVTISGIGLGNGWDITNVTICGVEAVIVSQTADSVTVVLGAGGSLTGNIVIDSASAGVTTFVNDYTYNPPGAMFGPFLGWSSISNLPRAVSGLTATSVNGKIYAIGGYNGSNVLSDVYVYDTAQPTNGWMSISNLPVVSQGMAATTVNGKIYAIGGIGPGIGAQSTVFVYDPAQPTQGWLSISNLPWARGFLAATTVNGKIYIMGGYNPYLPPYTYSTVNVYDPSQPTLGWLSLSNLPVSASGLAAAVLNGKIYAIAGDNYVYDPAQPTLGWLSMSNLPTGGSDLAVAALNGKIYAVGGLSYDPVNGWTSQSTVYVYDPSQPKQAWLNVSNLPQPLGYLAGASANGNIYAIGGVNNNSRQSTVYASSMATGVVPSSGPLAGGNTVSIRGINLGNQDVTNVTLCGIPATILADNSPTQVVVSAGAAIVPINGDVVVDSTSYGVTVASKAYTYFQLPTIMTAFDGTNLQLSWPTNCLGWWLEAQTNGLGNNWFPVAGSPASNQFLIFVNPANGSVFYRLHQ